MSRPRLLRSLAGRWNHRVTAVIGGPGLGKTTLLVQAIAENRLAPRGEDVWIGLQSHDAEADRLARVVANALDDREPGNGSQLQHPDVVPQPATVADALWRRSPSEACLVLDDVHMLPSRSTGAAWLGDLVAALPANGHLLMAGRSEPPVALSRLSLQGAALRLAEDDLRFSDEEIQGFARQRGLEVGRFLETGGWPAMAELTASMDQRFTGEYLWEEILEPLGTVRRHVLAVLCDLGGADDQLASAAVGTRVELTSVLEGVPLMARDAHGWYVPHGLWHTAPGIALDPSEQVETRRRAVENLHHRGRFDDAFRLIEEIELWEAAPDMLRAACLANDRLTPGQLRRWLSASSAGVRTSAAGRLAAGLDKVFTKPNEAIQPLFEAALRCREDGDVEGELAAIAHLGQLSWWRQEPALLGDLRTRVVELERAGHPKARALATLGRAVIRDLRGEDHNVLTLLDSIEPNVFDPFWEMVKNWHRGLTRIDLDDFDGVEEILEDLQPSADPIVRYGLGTLQLRAWWAQGRVDDVLREVPEVLAAGRRACGTHNQYFGLVFAALAYGQVGDIEAGRRCFLESLAGAPDRGGLSVYAAMAQASLQLAEGDEPAAGATIREAMESHGLDHGLERRAWRHALPLSYVLVPETRDHWDATVLTGHLGLTRELARLTVACRSGQAALRLRSVNLPHLDTVRSALHFRFAAELAVGLAAVGRSEGAALFDALGPAGRDAVRTLTTSGSHQERDAKTLLAAVPAPPPRPSYLAVLGALTLRRDGVGGEEVLDPQLRRKRVQALVAYLVGNRRTTRAAICAALWPDLDERAAGNNLAVTLNHLLRLLEPWREAGEPGYLVRLESQSVQLVTDGYLRVDVDDFDEHLKLAHRAEEDGMPSVALEHSLAAAGLYRDELFLEVTAASWLALDREYYRTRFVAAAVRAGELLLGRDALDRAEEIAHRALAVDRWSEGAYAVLVGAALARGDRSGARRLLERSREALRELGAEPAEATRQLERRVQAAAS